MDQNQIMLALTKGDRVLTQELALLARAGIEPLDDPQSSRKLIFDTSLAGVQFMLLRSSDVATFVQHGISDVGMAGRDVLLEHCLLYTSPSPRDRQKSRMPSSA